MSFKSAVSLGLVACSLLSSVAMAEDEQLRGPTFGVFKTSDVMAGDTMPQIKSPAYSKGREGSFTVYSALGMVIWSWAIGKAPNGEEPKCSEVKGVFLNSPIDATYCRYSNNAFYINIAPNDEPSQEQLRVALNKGMEEEVERFTLFAGGESVYNPLTGFVQAARHFGKENALHIAEWKEMSNNIKRVVEEAKAIEEQE